MALEYERPQGFEKENRDCTVKSLSLVAELPYIEVHSAFKEVGRKDRHRVKSRKVIQKVCKILNLEAKQIRRSGSLGKLIRDYPQGRIWCLKRGHAFSLIDGIVYDESTDASIIGAWLIRKR